MAETNIRRFQAALLLITNPIRSRIPTLLSAVIPQVERNLYVVVHQPNVQLAAAQEKSLDPEQQKQRIRPMLHVIYKQLAATNNPSVDVLLHNVDAAIRSTSPLRLPRVCEAVFADCSPSPGLYDYCRDHFHQLDHNFELRTIEQKESNDDASAEALSLSEQDLFKSQSTSQYNRGVLGGESAFAVEMQLVTSTVQVPSIDYTTGINCY